ncbi:hypothetical protein L596_029439 [Steinernema carpocapsae]|nr:hypothetical protein L596_029439 [Steinernema carpocapsae]
MPILPFATSSGIERPPLDFNLLTREQFDLLEPRANYSLLPIRMRAVIDLKALNIARPRRWRTSSRFKVRRRNKTHSRSSTTTSKWLRVKHDSAYGTAQSCLLINTYIKKALLESIFLYIRGPGIPPDVNDLEDRDCQFQS